MAVGVVGTPSSGQATGSPSTISATVAAGATLLVVVTTLNGTATITDQTFNGTALRSDASLRRQGPTETVEIRYLENPSATTANIVTTLSAGNAHGVYWHAFDGTATTGTPADHFGDIQGADSGGGNTATPQATLTNLDTGSAAIAGCTHEGAAAMTGSGTNQVRLTRDHGTWNSAASYELFAAGAASDVQSFTNAASDSYAFLAAEIIPAGAGPPTHAGAAELALTVTTAAAASRETFGSASQPLTLSTASAGTRTTFATADQPFTLATTATGTRETFATLTLDLLVQLAAAGTVGGAGPTEHFGAAELPVTVATSAAGARQTFSTAELPLTLTIASQATRATFAAAVLPLTLAPAATGTLTAKGAAVLPLTFATAAAGNITQIHTGQAVLPFTFILAAAGMGSGANVPGTATATDRGVTASGRITTGAGATVVDTFPSRVTG